MSSIDEKTVQSFGNEWASFDQSRLSDEEATRHFDEYFAVFPWDDLSQGAAGADVGCGSGRWALCVAPRVGILHCIDASEQALDIARRNLVGQPNCHFHHTSVDAIPLPAGSVDFCCSLGVLHHVPDTLAGIKACAALLKPGAPFLLYLYYALDNRPWWFRAIWKGTDVMRQGIARLPFWPKRVLTGAIAVAVYWPIARLCAMVERAGGNPAALPLNAYRHDGVLTMRTDAFDRFGTRLEQRFTRAQIETIVRQTGLEDIRFSESPPYWCAVGRRRIEACEQTDVAGEIQAHVAPHPCLRAQPRAPSIAVRGDCNVLGGKAPEDKAVGRRHAAFHNLRRGWPGAAYLIAGMLLLLSAALADVAPRSALHYSPNHNFDSNGNYLPGKAGFNLADVKSVRQLEALPAAVKGLAWIGQCQGVSASFLHAVRPYIGSPKLFGFYLMDEPDPTGRHTHPCTAANLMAESDWIHANAPGAKTFIVVVNLSSSRTPSYIGTFNPDNSHVDLFGIDPYPCRTELFGCDYDMIDRYVAAAEASGIPRNQIVPVYQAFGAGHWKDDGGGQYALPSADQEQQILARWEKLLAAPVFDFAYSWGSQQADAALEDAPDLRAVFATFNGTPSVRRKTPLGIDRP